MIFIRDAREGVTVSARRGRIRPHFAAALFLVVPFLVFNSAASAGDLDTIVTFNIDAETIDKALLAFGSQAHLQIMFASNSSTSQARTKGIKGRCSVRSALAVLLRGTGLSYSEHGDTVEVVPIKWNLPGSPKQAVRSADPPSGVGAPEDRDPPKTQSPKSPGERKHPYGQLQEITVTGTRIEGVAPVGVPLQIISRVQIERSGYTTLDELLQSLPDDFRGGAAGASPDAGFTRGADRGYNGTFGSGVNLRGLGNDATLVLVDGHRVASSGSGYFTDISTIPLSAIDHIEILTDGTSAVYGSDAIAGVVNIILKSQSEGLDTGLRYGSGDGISTYDGNVEYGHQWSGGGFTVDTDYAGQGALDVRDRSFTSSIASPTDIFPMSHQVALSAAGHKLLGQLVNIHADVQYSDTRRLYTESLGVPAGQTYVDVPRWSGLIGARLRASQTWAVDFSLSAGEGGEEETSNNFTGAALKLSDAIRETSRFVEPRIDATGNVISLPGGAAKVAIGTSYLTQGFGHINYPPVTVYGDGRHVTSAYGEVWIPVVSDLNAIPGIARLTLSGADRYDRYSDFGGTRNYKVGLSWYPVDSLQLRGAYSTSFRAPAVGEELVASQVGTTYALLFPIYNAEGTAKIPALVLEGAQRNLRPETATNLTLGLDYMPSGVPGLRLSLDYYRIRYTSQLAHAPFSLTALSTPGLASVITQYPSSSAIQALVTEAVAGGAQYFNDTGGLFGPNPLNSTTYLYDLRTANLSRTDTDGFDIGTKYAFAIGRSAIDTDLDATYITGFFTQLTPASPVLEEVDTVGYPAKFRLTAQAAWTLANLGIAFTGNYVSSYPDTTSPVPRTVGSYLTFNCGAHYSISDGPSALRGSKITLSISNLSNRNPPYVTNGALTLVGSHYDAANASPLGRLISLEISKHW